MRENSDDTFGNYRLNRLLGLGRFADVYLGEHSYLKTPAVIKIFRARLVDEAATQFQAEAERIARLAHRAILPVHEFGVVECTPYLVEEYASSGSVGQRFLRRPSMSLPLVVQYTRQLAEALQYAHDHEIIHRNVKPENMLFGIRDEVLLCDFHLSTIVRHSHSRRLSDRRGAIAYKAPEQLRDQPVEASDQYALAIVVYEWLSGQVPFVGNSQEIAAQHMQSPPPALHTAMPSLPLDIERVVMRALAKEPAQRYSSILHFAQALEQAYLLHKCAQTVPPVLSPSEGQETGKPAIAIEAKEDVAAETLRPASLLGPQTEALSAASSAEPQTEALRPSFPTALPDRRPATFTASCKARRLEPMPLSGKAVASPLGQAVPEKQAEKTLSSQQFPTVRGNGAYTGTSIASPILQSLPMGRASQENLINTQLSAISEVPTRPGRQIQQRTMGKPIPVYSEGIPTGHSGKWILIALLTTSIIGCMALVYLSNPMLPTLLWNNLHNSASTQAVGKVADGHTLVASGPKLMIQVVGLPPRLRNNTTVNIKVHTNIGNVPVVMKVQYLMEGAETYTSKPQITDRAGNVTFTWKVNCTSMMGHETAMKILVLATDPAGRQVQYSYQLQVTP